MKRLALVLTLAAAVAGCASDPAANAPAVKASVATTTAGTGASALSVELLTDTRLETGMIPIYVKVTSAGGQAVTDADVTFEPMMAMSGGTSHAAPVGPPEPGSDGLYHGYAVFQMASSMMGSWSATVGVTRPGQARVDASFPSLTVADSGRAKTFSFFDPDTLTTTKYVASVRLLAAPKVGLNPLAVTLHRMQTMMTFPSVDDATVQLTPWMPSMNHGSPGSVDPVLVASGVYQGQLSFSMRGDWETTVTFTRGGRTIGAPKFANTF